MAESGTVRVFSGRTRVELLVPVRVMFRVVWKE